MNLFEKLKFRWVAWVWNHTPTCVEMTRLASLSLDRPLPLKTRAQIWLHWMICVWCKRYFRHLHLLHKRAPELSRNLESLPTPRFSADAKCRIKTRLREAVKPD